MKLKELKKFRKSLEKTELREFMEARFYIELGKVSVYILDVLSIINKSRMSRKGFEIKSEASK